ncbi:MAG: transcription antitermination factor NusB [Phycisphaerales bacterium]
MANPRETRKLAFQALFQLDARGADDAESIRAGLDPETGEAERDAAMALARAAYEDRAAADAEFLALAPTWPSHRLAAVDRAILRLAHYEMTSGRTPPKVAVNEAVELAKAFSTDRSPAFVNGLLDKVLKRVIGARGDTVADAPK